MIHDVVYFQRLWYEAKDPLMKAFYAAMLDRYCPGGIPTLRQLKPDVFEQLSPAVQIVKLLTSPSRDKERNPNDN